MEATLTARRFFEESHIKGIDEKGGASKEDHVSSKEPGLADTLLGSGDKVVDVEKMLPPVFFAG